MRYHPPNLRRVLLQPRRAVPRSMSVSQWHASRDEDSSPSEWLHAAAKATGHAVDSAEFAAWLDESDPLRASREKFHIPEHLPGQEQVYLCGNSLGPVPRATAAAVQTELQKWALGGVSGHFTGERRHHHHCHHHCHHHLLHHHLHHHYQNHCHQHQYHCHHSHHHLRHLLLLLLLYHHLCLLLHQATCHGRRARRCYRR